MGRHADAGGARPRGRRDRTGRRRGSVRLLLLLPALGLVVLLGGAVGLLASGVGPGLLGRDDVEALPVAGGGGAPVGEGCDRYVDVTVATGSELSAATAVLDAAPLGPTDDGLCARPRTVELGPAQTLDGLVAGRDGPRRPDVWLPDSSLWEHRAQEAGVAVASRGSLGTSPVVVATSVEVVTELGWRETPPTWGQVLTGSGRALAVPDLGGSAGALMAIGAARDAAGEEGSLLTVQTALARQRAGSLTPSQGLLQASTEGADAPLVVTSEQDVLRRTGGAASSPVLAVSPVGGTPVLDHPVLAVPPVSEREDDEEAAVELVLAALTSGTGRALAVEAGLRGPDLELLPGVAGLVEPSPPSVAPDPVALDLLAADLSRLAPPSELLVVVDVSLSMSAEVGDGFTRADVAAEALGRALADLPDTSRVGLWQFASLLDGEQDHVEALPVRALGSPVDGRLQRDLLADAVAELPDSLVSGGTSLYDTVDAAVASAQEEWDEAAVSTVVVITDGQNEDSDGLDLDDLTQRLTDVTDPQRPVGLVLVGFGPDADLSALEELAAVGAGGPAQAVDARNPNALQSLLVQLLAARTAASAVEPSAGAAADG